VVQKSIIINTALSPFGRVFLALLSSVLLVLSFPGPDQGWLAWIALVPLLFACADLKPGASLSLGLLSGIVATFGIFQWMLAVPGFRWFHAGMAAFYLGLYTAAWCSGVSLARRACLPLVVIAPPLWVVLDFLKAHAGFLSLPWATLAHSQHGFPAVLQIAAATGEYGVTFLIVLVNAAIAAFIINPGYAQPLAAGAVLTSVIAYGRYQLSSVETSEPLRVAVVQPCIWPGEQQKDTGQTNTLMKLEKLTADAAATSVQLIVWPETALLNLQVSPSLRQRLDSLSGKYSAALLVGASEHVKFTDRPAGDPATNTIRSYNAAYLIKSGTPVVEPYRKNLLIPFGEYRPLEGKVSWPKWFVSKGFDTVPGKELNIFRLHGGTGFGVLICWENLFPEMAGREVRMGARLLVNLVNDGWFGKSGAPRQHNCASVLRAVENGVPVVVASNCGPSQIIDGHGRVVASLPDTFSPGVVSSEVTVGRSLTFYTRYGDYFAWSCLGISLLALRGRIPGRLRENKSAVFGNSQPVRSIS
jgi:apolipoprotein N-acyltransferase